MSMFLDKFQLLQAVISDPQLSAYAKVVFARIVHHYNSITGQCNPSYKTLAAGCGMSRRRAIEGVKALEKAGWISAARASRESVKGPGEGLPSNTFSLAFDRLGTANPSVEKSTRASAENDTTPSVENVTTLVLDCAPDPSAEIDTQIQEETLIQEEKPGTVTLFEPDETVQAMAAYNRAASAAGWPTALTLNGRVASMRKRLKDAGGLAGWVAAMDRARCSPFLCGNNKNGWRADLDFFLQARSFRKLREGSYDERKPKNDLAAAFDKLNERIARKAAHASGEDPRTERVDLELTAVDDGGDQFADRRFF